MKYTKEQIENARHQLRAVRKGDTLYTVVRNVARSGMSREIRVFIARKKEVRDISWAVAVTLGWSQNKDSHAVKVSGCGMDMGVHLVNCLSYAMHGTKCEKAGYTLDQRWL